MKKKYIFFSIIFVLFSALTFYIITYEDPKVSYAKKARDEIQNSRIILQELDIKNTSFIYLYLGEIYINSNKNISKLPDGYRESSWEIRDKFPNDHLNGSTFISNSLPVGTKLYTSETNAKVIYVKNDDSFVSFHKYKN